MKLDMNPINKNTAQGAYIAPTWKVVDKHGLQPAGELLMQYVKGNKDDPTAYRQEGITTETQLIILIDQMTYQSSVVPSEITNQTLYHLREALRLQQERTLERDARGVLGSYEK